MKSLFSSLVAHPALYYSLALSILFAFAGFAVANVKALGENRKFEWGFLILAGSTLLIWRLPVLLWPQPFNIDEGNWGACALKATYDFAPWRGFDATTSGPLNPDILAFPAIFGAPITFFSTRMIGCGLMAAALFGFYFIAKWTLGAATARLALIPPVAFLALTWEWDFLHYSSEEFPILLTTLGVAAGTYLLVEKRGAARLAACAAGGVLLGAASFAKLQVLPLALAAAALVAAMIHFTAQPGKQRRMENVSFGLGLGAVPLAIAISLTITNEWNDAIISYLKAGVVYVNSGTTVGLPFFFLTAMTYSVFAACALGVIALGLVGLRGRRSFSKRSLVVSLCAVGFLVVSLFVVVAPRRAYPHYLLFSVLPLSYAVATVLQLTRETMPSENRRAIVRAILALLFIGPALGAAMAHPCPYLGELRDLLLSSNGPHSSYLPFQNPSQQIQAISKYAPPRTRVSIWGWMPHYYVQTQTISATRDTCTNPQLRPGPYQEYFRERYLAELRSNPPPVFVDAVAPASFGYNQRATDGFESFPALAAFIGEHYQLAEEVGGVRIFTLNKQPASRPNEKNGG